MNEDKYTPIGKHKNCKYRGTVFQLSDRSGNQWQWCDGRSWESEKSESIKKIWKHCGKSTLNGDKLEIEHEGKNEKEESKENQIDRTTACEKT